MIGLFKTELYRNPALLERNGGPWKGLTDLEVAICARVNARRLHSELTDCTPAELGAAYYASHPHVALA